MVKKKKSKAGSIDSSFFDDMNTPKHDSRKELTQPPDAIPLVISIAKVAPKVPPSSNLAVLELLAMKKKASTESSICAENTGIVHNTNNGSSDGGSKETLTPLPVHTDSGMNSNTTGPGVGLNGIHVVLPTVNARPNPSISKPPENRAAHLDTSVEYDASPPPVIELENGTAMPKTYLAAAGNRDHKGGLQLE